MSLNINNTYLFFGITNYTGVSALTSYSTPETPLNFVPDFTTSPLLSTSRSISNKTLRWDFGDGSFSTDLTASHSYSWQGNYNIRLTVYDENGNAYDSSYTPSVAIYDIMPTQISFDTSLTDTTNKFIGPLRVKTYNSWQSYPALSSTGYTVNFYASGAAAKNRSNINFENDKWLHLRSSSNFYTVEKINGVDQFIDITSLTATQERIYMRIQNQQLQFCKESDTNSFLVGTSGYCDVYYTDDSISNIINNKQTNIFASFDSQKFRDLLTQKNELYNYIDYPPYGFQNLAPALYVAAPTAYNPAVKIDITTTGIAGEGTLSTTVFDIPVISWQDTQIPYVITLKDVDNYTTKFYPALSSSTANSNVSSSTFDVKTGIIYLSSGSYYPLSGVTFYEDFVAAIPQSTGSFYKGYFVANRTSENCILTASVTIADPVTLLTSTITGSSNTFNIYSTAGKFNIAKINEDWDASGFYKSLRYQENLIDKEKFFNDFLGTIVGGVSAYPYELGKTVYEKIANFTDNRADVDKSNLDALIAFCKELSIQFEQYNYAYPPQLRRIVDLLSIKQTVLWGESNQYDTSFNTGTNIITDITKGINLGSEISVLTGTITIGSPIVAYEIFSSEYNLVNQNGISGYSIGTSLPLSTFSYDWGWGLVLPPSLSGINVANYYRFYSYTDTTDKVYYNNVINWSDPFTTLNPQQSAFTDWSMNDGIMQTLLSYELTKGLQLFTSATGF